MNNFESHIPASERITQQLKEVIQMAIENVSKHAKGGTWQEDELNEIMNIVLNSEAARQSGMDATDIKEAMRPYLQGKK